MYLQYFGLREAPFSLTPDTSYFFASRPHREALDTLLVALKNGEGFIKVTGEVGTGKTLLCRQLLNTLHDPLLTAYIPNPFLSPGALVLALADELGLEMARDIGQHRALKEISERLVTLSGEGKQLVLCIDEAQAMPDDTLEALRLLTNLETEKRKLLQVVLFGQPELNERLAATHLRQLRQRITFSYHLEPLDDVAVESYLSHRLAVAGGQGGLPFERNALELLIRASGGIPRLINILAHKSLMAGFGQGSRTIRSDHVNAAVSDTDDARLNLKTEAWSWPTVAVLIAGTLLLMTLVGYGAFYIAGGAGTPGAP